MILSAIYQLPQEYIQRSNLPLDGPKRTTKSVQYIRKGPNSNSTGGGGTYDWNSEQQGYILGAFFYGYMITQGRFHISM